MEKRRWSEHDARPALSIPGPQANAGHDRSLAFYLAAAETAIASEATSVLLVAQPKRLMFLGDKPGQRRFRPDRETIAPQPDASSGGLTSHARNNFPGPPRPFIDAAKVGRIASLPGQRRLAAVPTATRLRIQTCRRLPPFGRAAAHPPRGSSRTCSPKDPMAGPTTLASRADSAVG